MKQLKSYYIRLIEDRGKLKWFVTFGENGRPLGGYVVPAEKGFGLKEKKVEL